MRLSAGTISGRRLGSSSPRSVKVSVPGATATRTPASSSTLRGAWARSAKTTSCWKVQVCATRSYRRARSSVRGRLTRSTGPRPGPSGPTTSHQPRSTPAGPSAEGTDQLDVEPAGRALRIHVFVEGRTSRLSAVHDGDEDGTADASAPAARPARGRPGPEPPAAPSPLGRRQRGGGDRRGRRRPAPTRRARASEARDDDGEGVRSRSGRRAGPRGSRAPCALPPPAPPPWKGVRELRGRRP
jgi:hypothetical protein